MINYILPPKRWESAEPTKYDQIRYHKWFARLTKRKHHIAMLDTAWRDGLTSDLNQQQLCAKWGIDSREYRDYCFFKKSGGGPIDYDRNTREIIDRAYVLYCSLGAKNSYRNCIKQVAVTFGVNPRAIIELWETMPDLYPTGYKP